MEEAADRQQPAAGFFRPCGRSAGCGRRRHGATAHGAEKFLLVVPEGETIGLVQENRASQQRARIIGLDQLLEVGWKRRSSCARERAESRSGLDGEECAESAA